MGNLFNLDNPIMRFLSKVFDVIFLSLIWGVFCLPVITIGAATTAMYYTSVKVIRRERGYVWAEFWKSFKMNFVQSTISWVLSGFGTALFIVNIIFAYKLNSNFGIALMIFYIVVCGTIFGTALYLFPVISRFAMKLSALVKTCLFLVFKYLPKTFLLGIIVLLSCLIIYFVPATVLFIPVCATLIFSIIMEPILKKYTPHAGDDERRDEWYLE